MSPLSLDLSLGPVQVGFSVATFLYGLLMVQVYGYYQDYPGDPIVLKALVATIGLAELVHQTCCSHAVYFYTITEFGNFQLFSVSPPKTFFVAILCYGLTTILVSGVLIYRLWGAARQRIIAGFLAILMFFRFSVVLALAGFAFERKSFVDFVKQTWTLLAVSLVAVTVGEIFLTLALCYDLHCQRHTAAYRNWTAIERLVMWYIATGVVTSVVASAMVICFFAMRDNFVWMGFLIPLPRFFGIALLASLNTRTRVYGTHLSAIQFNVGNSESQNTTVKNTGPVMHVSIVTDTRHTLGGSDAHREIELKKSVVVE